MDESDGNHRVSRFSRKKTQEVEGQDLIAKIHRKLRPTLKKSMRKIGITYADYLPRTDFWVGGLYDRVAVARLFTCLRTRI